MKNLFGLAAAALLFGATSAQAVPIMTMSVTQATGTASQCSAATGGAGLFVGSTCTLTSTSGITLFVGAFGSYELAIELGKGYPAQSQPALWLNSNVSTSTAGGISVTLVAQNYFEPAGDFNVLSTASGTVDTGMSYSISNWYDVANGGVAGIGQNLLSDSKVGDGTSVAKNVLNAITHNDSDLYTVSWIFDAVRTAPFNGQLLTVGVNGTLGAVPAPGALALIGLGLLGIGAIRRRVK